MKSSLIQQLKQDCLAHGYGRKKWWADLLGVPPLTLSHWLAGRQRPNGTHTLKILETLRQGESDQQKRKWGDSLWESYYRGEEIPQGILPLALLEILSLPTVDSRTLALLSRLTEKRGPRFDVPTSPRLKNRVGWLLETSNQKPSFAPERFPADQPLLPLSTKSSGLRHYLRKQQTSVGQKWQLLDCSLDSLKDSLP